MRLVYLILVQYHANFPFFAVQATARVSVQLLAVQATERVDVLLLTVAEALLDMIDAIDTDMNARAANAELIPWLLVSGSCIKARSKEFSQHHARHPITHQTMLRAAELHGIHTAAGPSVHASLQEFHPPRGGKTLRRVLLGSRVQLRTCQIWTPANRCSDSCCSHSCTQQHRTKTARNIELLAGASSIGTRWSSVSFSKKQKRLLETGELFPRGSQEASHARRRGRSHRQRARGARGRCTGRRPQQRRRRHAHWCRGISGTSGCRCSRESSHECA